MPKQPVAVHTEKTIVNRRGNNLAAHYWHPTGGSVRALVFLSHGFSEHLGLYVDVANYLCERKLLVFGHDHVGHGKSDGKRAYVENVDEYCDDVIEHAQQVKEEYPDLKCFLLGHSMGGMVAIRAVLMQKDFFQGMILNGPLIVPGPQILGMDLRATPLRTFLSRLVLSFLSLFIPEVELGKPNLNIITRDTDMHRILLRDSLRWTGGCKVRLLLAFTNCLDENINHLSDVRTPFLIIHGAGDSLCNPVGSDLLVRRSRSEDKLIKLYPEAQHQLFFEYPAVRQEAFQDVADWIGARL